jgi:hypothetical protein
VAEDQQEHWREPACCKHSVLSVRMWAWMHGRKHHAKSPQPMRLNKPYMHAHHQAAGTGRVCTRAPLQRVQHISLHNFAPILNAGLSSHVHANSTCTAAPQCANNLTSIPSWTSSMRTVAACPSKKAVKPHRVQQKGDKRTQYSISKHFIISA